MGHVSGVLVWVDHGIDIDVSEHNEKSIDLLTEPSLTSGLHDLTNSQS
jgi:hypothetical protein